MPPKAQTKVLRGRGRPKGSAASPARTAVAPTPAKRGRPAKAQAEEPAVVADPPKGGRRSLVAPEPRVEEAPKKRVGRPRKEEPVAEAPASTPKKGGGRPKKAEVAAEEVSATPKKRAGRPAKNAVDLNRVAGSPRVTKHASPRSRPAAKTTKTAPVPRMNPRMRSKLRTRLPPARKVTKEEPATQPAKRRGRPSKVVLAAPFSLKKPGGRKPTKGTTAKPTAPRKKRGFTMLEVPDKFAAQLRQFLQELQDAESLPTPVEEEGAEEEAEAQARGDEELDVDVTVEEDMHITSVTASDQENDPIMTERDQENQDHIDVDVEENDLQDEVVQGVVVHEDIEEEPTSALTEVEIKMSVQEVVQVEHDNDDMDMYGQDEDENFEAHGNGPASLLDDEATDELVREAESRPSIGVIFG